MNTSDNSGISDLIRASDAARSLGVNPRTLAAWSSRGILPDPVRVGPRELRYYYRRDIDALLHSQGA